jgi:hypothetical protein
MRIYLTHAVYLFEHTFTKMSHTMECCRQYLGRIVHSQNDQACCPSTNPSSKLSKLVILSSKERAIKFLRVDEIPDRPWRL